MFNSRSNNRFLTGAGQTPKTAQTLFSKTQKNDWISSRIAVDHLVTGRHQEGTARSQPSSNQSNNQQKTSQYQGNSLDLDKLARSVSIAETSGCTKGSALSVKNCFGIMQFDKKGNRSLKRFNTHQDSFKEFKRIWSMHYKEFPDQKLANKWVNGNFGATTKGSIEWLSTVIQQYNQS